MLIDDGAGKKIEAGAQVGLRCPAGDHYPRHDGRPRARSPPHTPPCKKRVELLFHPGSEIGLRNPGLAPTTKPDTRGLTKGHSEIFRIGART